MNDTPTESLSIECGTCLAAGTTACTDCIVTHLLANDDGPVDFVPVAVTAPAEPAPTAEDRVIELFRRAGLVDDPVVLVSVDDFAGTSPYAGAGAPARSAADDRRDP